jgi:hypothetical protein
MCDPLRSTPVRRANPQGRHNDSDSRYPRSLSGSRGWNHRSPTFKFSPTDITRRFEVPSIVSDVPTAISDVPIAVSSALGVIKSAVSDVPTAVSSALGVIKSAVSEVTPRNCTVGTKYACLGFTSGVSCRPLPLEISQVVPDVRNLAGLEERLKFVTAFSMEGCLIIGFAFVTIALILDVLSLCWRHKATELAQLICSVFGVVGFLAPTIIVHKLFDAASHLPIKTHKGMFFDICLGCAICAAIMTILLIRRPSCMT